jgi:hypothetical protein
VVVPAVRPSALRVRFPASSMSKTDSHTLEVRDRAPSVARSFSFDMDDAGNLTLKAEFRNERYDPTLDDPDSKAVDADSRTPRSASTAFESGSSRVGS